MADRRRGTMLAVAAAALLLLSEASCLERRGSRRLRAVEADLQTDPADQPTFNLVTSCPPHYQRDQTIAQLYKGVGYDVVDMTATIEMDQEITYANNFRDNDPTTWAPGQTRINYTVEISPHGGQMPKQLVARLHTSSCFSQLDEETVYLLDPKKAASDVEATIDIDADTHTGKSSTVKDYLIDYDETQSLVVYNGKNMVACCDLIPPFPDFPTEWAATVEANIINQGYTYVQKETYSEARNMVRVDLHSYDKDIVMLQDYSAKKTTIIFPANTTYPNGVCQQREFIPSMTNFVDEENGSVYGTSNFLMFEGKTEADKPNFDPGHVSVRGIPCEAWYRKIDNAQSNSSFDVQFFFPVNQWLVARENYHRMLKQISVVGTIDGEDVDHRYSYINFRPYSAPDGVFDACAIAPLGTNCNCTGKKAASAVQEDHAIQFAEDGESVQITKLEADNSSTAALAAGAGSTTLLTCPKNDQFLDSQQRWYGMWAAIGFALGIFVAWLGSVLWYRSVVGVRGTDRFGHSKLKERPFIIGRQQSHSASSYI